MESAVTSKETAPTVQDPDLESPAVRDADPDPALNQEAHPVEAEDTTEGATPPIRRGDPTRAARATTRDHAASPQRAAEVAPDQGRVEAEATPPAITARVAELPPAPTRGHPQSPSRQSVSPADRSRL